jgi:hypothetical protein
MPAPMAPFRCPCLGRERDGHEVAQGGGRSPKVALLKGLDDQLDCEGLARSRRCT